MMRSALLGTICLLVACSDATALDEAGSQDAFRSMLLVMADVQLQTYDALAASDAAKALSLSSEDGSLVISGDLDGGLDWDGTIGVDGDVSFSDLALYGFDLSLDCEAVDVSDLVMDGWVEWEADGAVANDIYDYTAETYGELDVSGSTDGTVSFDYTVEIEIDAALGTYQYTADGQVNGYDISAWENLLSGAGVFQYD